MFSRQKNPKASMADAATKQKSRQMYKGISFREACCPHSISSPYLLSAEGAASLLRGAFHTVWQSVILLAASKSFVFLDFLLS